MGNVAVRTSPNTARNESIKELWQKNPGWTAEAVAAALGLTKNVVIGVLNRSGLLDGTRGLAPRPKPRLCEPVLDEDIGDRKPVEFMKLEPHHCRWPVGRGKDGLASFCGAKKLLKTSYCEDHFKRNRGGYTLRGA